MSRNLFASTRRAIFAANSGDAFIILLTLEVVRAVEPDVVEAAFHDFRLNNVRYDSQVIEADLTIEDFTAEPYPAESFTPACFQRYFNYLQIIDIFSM